MCVCVCVCVERESCVIKGLGSHETTTEPGTDRSKPAGPKAQGCRRAGKRSPSKMAVGYCANGRPTCTASIFTSARDAYTHARVRIFICLLLPRPRRRAKRSHKGIVVSPCTYTVCPCQHVRRACHETGQHEMSLLVALRRYISLQCGDGVLEGVC